MDGATVPWTLHDSVTFYWTETKIISRTKKINTTILYFWKLIKTKTEIIVATKIIEHVSNITI